MSVNNYFLKYNGRTYIMRATTEQRAWHKLERLLGHTIY